MIGIPWTSALAGVQWAFEHGMSGVAAEQGGADDDGAGS